MEATGQQESSEGLTRTTTVVRITHVRVWTAKPFAEVIRRLEAETGVFDLARIRARIQDNTPSSSVIDAIASMAGRSGFMRFVAPDQGAILRLTGAAR